MEVDEIGDTDERRENGKMPICNCRFFVDLMFLESMNSVRFVCKVSFLTEIVFFEFYWHLQL